MPVRGKPSEPSRRPTTPTGRGVPSGADAGVAKLAAELARDGLTGDDVDALLQATDLAEGGPAALTEVLAKHADAFAHEGARERLSAFAQGAPRLMAEALRAESDDGIVDVAEAAQLLAAAKAPLSLADVLVGSRLTDDARALLSRHIDVHAFARPHGERPVFLVGGVPLADPRADASLPEVRRSGLFRLAELCADRANRPFADVPLAEREALLASLVEAVSLSDGDNRLGDDTVDAGPRQQRASAMTCLLALAVDGAGRRQRKAGRASGDANRATLKGRPRDRLAEGRLLGQAVETLAHSLEVEPLPALRSAMAFHLADLAPRLPAALAARARAVAAPLAPRSPPYDTWFQGGARELNVSWTCGKDPEFLPGTLALLRAQGFKSDPNDQGAPPVFLTRELEGKDGETYTVRIAVDVDRGELFQHMGSERVHIVGYDGHSDMGRVVPRSLRTAPDEVGEKLVFYGLCAGKDTLSRVRERFPASQVLTTFTSCFYRVEDDAMGQPTMTASENLGALLCLVEGAVYRRDWEAIHDDIREKAILFPRQHVMPGGTNYLSPVHTAIRRRLLDSDHDGQADWLDRLVTFDTTRIASDTAREMEPIPPGRPARALEGTVVHLATQGLNTATGFADVTQRYKRQSLIGGGYFDPKGKDEPIVRFEPIGRDEGDHDRTPLLALRVNALHAHLSVEALRALAGFALVQDLPELKDRPLVDRRLAALLFAAACLLYDDQPPDRDRAVWRALLAHHGLPELALDEATALLCEEPSRYAGSWAMVERWKAGLDDRTLAALSA